jgi:uncharacterized peroxidase-related enzyme
MPRIQTIEAGHAEGELAEVYQSILKSRGKIASVHKIQSLHPKSIVAHMDLYMQIMYSRSPLNRAQREMMAVVVSRNNDCEYCQIHHAEAVMNYWKDADKVEQLRRDWRKVELSEADQSLCEYAEVLTGEPGRAGAEDLTIKLREQGFEDRAILDATLVIAYFNFVNRIVLSLGVELEENPGGYKYE